MKFIFVLLAATCFVVSVYGQDPAPTTNTWKGDVEQEIEVVDGEVTPQLKIFLTYGGKTKAGLYCWFQASKPYSQIYCGPTYQPKEWLQVGAAVGLETAKRPVKAAVFIWTGKGKFSNLLILEKGSYELWYRNQFGYQVSKNLNLSLASQRFQGTGPRVEYSVPKTNFKVGGEYNISSRTAKFGVTFSF